MIIKFILAWLCLSGITAAFWMILNGRDGDSEHPTR
jgi:hypothetical protein